MKNNKEQLIEFVSKIKKDRQIIENLKRTYQLLKNNSEDMTDDIMKLSEE